MKTTLLILTLLLTIDSYSQERQLDFTHKPQMFDLREIAGDNPTLAMPAFLDLDAINSRGKNLILKYLLPESLHLYDSTCYWEFDTLSSEWIKTERLINYTYDGNFNLLNYTHQQFNNDSWENYKKYFRTYNDQNDHVGSMTQNWVEGDWANYSQILNTYDENDNLILRSNQLWKNGNWENYEQYSYTFDVYNNMTSNMKLRWDSTGWKKYSYYTYTYDVQNNLSTSIFQLGVDTSWVNNSKQINSYNANNKIITGLNLYWIGNAWVNSTKHIYTYDAGNKLINKTTQMWTGINWENWLLVTYTYYTNNNLESDLHQTWEDNGWRTDNIHTYTYDVNNNEITDLSQQWNGIEFVDESKMTSIYDFDDYMIAYSFLYWDTDNNEIILGDSGRYFTYTNVEINEFPLNEEILSVYPNPGIGKLTISSTHPLGMIEIYNLQGELVYSNGMLEIRSKVIIDLYPCVKGTYLIKMDNGQRICTKKIIIQ